MQPLRAVQGRQLRRLATFIGFVSLLAALVGFVPAQPSVAVGFRGPAVSRDSPLGRPLVFRRFRAWRGRCGVAGVVRGSVRSQRIKERRSISTRAVLPYSPEWLARLCCSNRVTGPFCPPTRFHLRWGIPPRRVLTLMHCRRFLRAAATHGRRRSLPDLYLKGIHHRALTVRHLTGQRVVVIVHRTPDHVAEHMSRIAT